METFFKITTFLFKSALATLLFYGATQAKSESGTIIYAFAGCFAVIDALGWLD